MLTYQIPLSPLIALLFVSVSLSNPDTTALLAFKASSDPANSLSSWLNSSDPCSHAWLGVTCNPHTQQVTGLVLESLNLSGSTQPLSQLPHLILLSLKHNHLSSDSLDLSSWPNIKHLYLSHNRFRGIFPAGIFRLGRLRRLDLSHNEFSGSIPMAELTQLSHLLTLRLESNSFDGELETDSLYSYTISDFNVSSNNLSGKIPEWLSQFPTTSFAGNSLLCGKPLPYDCSNLTFHNGSVSVPAGMFGHKHTRLSDGAVRTIISIDVAAVFLAIIVTLTCCWYKKRLEAGAQKTMPQRDYARKYHCRSMGFKGNKGQAHGNLSRSGRSNLINEGEGMVVFDGECNGLGKVDDLLKASAEMLGKGSVGATYKVVMDDGNRVLVVKRVREIGRRKEVDGWLSYIGSLRHSNIVNLRAYHRSSNELLLVYDYLPNGSLHYLLHGNRGPGRTPLDWCSRLKIASGAAQGLAFLHDHDKSKLCHGHLSSSNIIVDHSGNACISDIALHRLLQPSLTTNGAYTAPELVLGNSSSPRKFTHKCDVYSFGVVLLEMLTGKMMTDQDGETSMAKWVQSVGREEWTWEVLDFELLKYRDMEEEMMGLLQVALLCLVALPKQRPTMSMVHRMIEDIRTKGINTILQHLSSSVDGSSPNSLSDDQSTPNFISS